jgi:hypothetical protein
VCSSDLDTCRQLVPGLVEVDCGGMHIVVPHDEGDLCKIAIAPRDIYISDALPPGSSVNRYAGIITAVDQRNTLTRLSLEACNHTFDAEMPTELAKEMGLVIGKEVYLILRLRRLRVLRNKDKGSGEHGVAR